MASDDFSVGVHLEVLKSLHRDHPELTTENLCEKVIKPATAPAKCCYLDLLNGVQVSGNFPAIGPATCFVSHAWRCKFADIIDCLDQHEAKHPNSYYWFDLVTNNQHMATVKPFEWWCTTFREAISRIGTVLIVMTPWHAPIPISRVWCLFEVYSAISVRAKIHVLLPQSDQALFRAAFSVPFDGQEHNVQGGVPQPTAVATQVLTSLDAARAQATNPADRDRIFEVISKFLDNGFDSLNMTIMSLLRSWYKRLCDDVCASNPTDPETLYNVACAQEDFGCFDAAQELFRKCLTRLETDLGESHPRVGRVHLRLSNHFMSTYGDATNAAEAAEKSIAVFSCAPSRCDAELSRAHIALGDALQLSACFLSLPDDARPLRLRAVQNFEKAMELIASLGGVPGAAAARSHHVLSCLAALHKALGNEAVAQDFETRASKEPMATSGPGGLDSMLARGVLQGACMGAEEGLF